MCKSEPISKAYMSVSIDIDYSIDIDIILILEEGMIRSFTFLIFTLKKNHSSIYCCYKMKIRIQITKHMFLKKM